MRTLKNTLKHMNGFEIFRILEKYIMHPTTRCNMRAKPMRLKVSIFLTQLFIFSFQVNADNLDTLPPHWQQQLEGVIQVDISPLKPAEQKAIEQARAKVDALLLHSNTDKKLLASEYGRLGNQYLTHDLFTTADACYNNAKKLAPGHFPSAYYSAYLAQQDGNMQLALSRFKQASELDPGYLPARYRLAQVYLELNRLDEAYALFNQLLSDTEFKAAAHNGLGQVFLMKQEYTSAAQHFTLALELAPEANSIHYPLALSLRAAGNKQLAKQHLQQYGKRELIINDPLVDALEALKDPASRHFVAAMSAVMKKEYANAITEFKDGLEYEPDNTAARTSYARVLYLNNDKEKSRQQLNQVIAQKPEKTLALFLLALLNDESNKNNEAAELYRRVIEMDPAHEGAHFFLGNYYLHIKDYSNASKHYEMVTQYNEKNIPAHVFNLVARMGSGASDKELIELTQKITDRVPNMFSIKRIQILLLALSNEEGVRDSELAKNLAQKMYKLAQYPVNLELLALTNASAGDFDLAVQQMQKAVTAEKQYKKSSNHKRMQDNLLLLQNKHLPGLQWQQEIAHMLPPPTHAMATFRDYPDANPI
jgi:cytochrome c-type biogenesis protein CcmH/NrfG